MSQITVKDLTFSYDTNYENIFDHASFLIDTDWRLGFIGRNGRGKTTLLKLFMGELEYQGNIQASVHFDYFPFEVKNPNELTVNVVKDIIAPYRQWEQEMEECLKDIHRNLERYGRVQELYQAHDGYTMDEQIEKELNKLEVDPSVLGRIFSTLSFGERTKVMLVALFLKKNHFLLIDEPTNHLDLEGRDTLAEYLRTKNGFLLVSHDRAFLDRCIDHVLSINKANIEVQQGNYSSWQYNKELQDQYELERNEQLKKDIASLGDAARRTSGWSDQVEASKIGTHPSDRGYIGHKAAKLMKRAKAIENRRLEAIEEKKSLLNNIESVVDLKINILPFPKQRLIELQDISLFYGEQKITTNINFTLFQGDRIAIQGKNGSGKSTLLKLLLGEDISYTGSYQVASELKISYVSQDTSYLQGDLTSFAKYHGLDETIFKTVLRQLDFSRNQFDKDIRYFSGGQKKKVLLAKSLAEPAHIFLWDEPLNFIDVYSRIQIEELILKYQPSMVFVEHDRVFTQKVSTKIIELE